MSLIVGQNDFSILHPQYFPVKRYINRCIPLVSRSRHRELQLIRNESNISYGYQEKALTLTRIRRGKNNKNSSLLYIVPCRMFSFNNKIIYTHALLLTTLLSYYFISIRINHKNPTLKTNSFSTSSNFYHPRSNFIYTINIYTKIYICTN